MKSLSSGLATHVAQPVTALAFCLRITAADGDVIAMTEHSRALTVDGTTYKPGMTVGSLASTLGLEVDNAEYELFPDEEDPEITTADVLSGKWDGAVVEILQVNWLVPSDGAIGHKRGNVGNVVPNLGSYTFEFRDLRQALRTDTSAVFQINCRARLGDSHCTVDLAPFTFAGTVTAVASNKAFTAAALTQDTDYFTEGKLTWYSGPNTGLAVKVKGFGASGVVTLAEPMLRGISEGDTFLIIAGCLKRREDCRDKFDNVLNFQGEPDKPDVEELVRQPA